MNCILSQTIVLGFARLLLRHYFEPLYGVPFSIRMRTQVASPMTFLPSAFPDSLNKPQWPSTRLNSGGGYSGKIVYKFSVRKESARKQKIPGRQDPGIIVQPREPRINKWDSFPSGVWAGEAAGLACLCLRDPFAAFLFAAAFGG